MRLAGHFSLFPMKRKTKFKKDFHFWGEKVPPQRNHFLEKSNPKFLEASNFIFSSKDFTIK